jgi:hypothetical protein
MNALKRKVDDSSHDTQDSIRRMQRDLEAKFDAEGQKHQLDVQALKQQTQSLQEQTQALQGQLAQVLQILLSKP